MSFISPPPPAPSSLWGRVGRVFGGRGRRPYAAAEGREGRGRLGVRAAPRLASLRPPAGARTATAAEAAAEGLEMRYIIWYPSPNTLITKM